MITLNILLADSRDICPPENTAASLNRSSQIRLADIHLEPRRQALLLGRWLMAKAADCPLDQISEGASYPIYQNQPNWHASISHSGPYVALVFSDQYRFGLDIEYPARERDWSSLAERAFSPSEAAWINNAPVGQENERFQRIWTLREAAFKAGLLPAVISKEPAFDPASESIKAGLHWQYLQQAGLHLSVVGPVAFTARCLSVSTPDSPGV